MPQFKDFPVAPGARRVRLELAPADAEELARIGAEGGGLAIAAVSRIALSLLARGEPVTRSAVLEEARRVQAATLAKRSNADGWGCLCGTAPRPCAL